ncbi:MAG: MBOAT family protein [Planctomycetota bacterium]
MSFNSISFAVFFVVVYTAYLLLRRSVLWQNVLLLVGSYVFYGWWDWRFCGLLLASTVIDYTVARVMHASSDDKRRKRLLWVSLCANLGMLGVFKYFDFFSASVQSGLARLGLEADPLLLNVVLPVGISFYTFQTLSYTIDVYRRKMEPVDSLLNFGVYVAFFPQLVAGPIERATHLLPQVCRARKVELDQVNAGIYLILWGLFKKMVIADNMAVHLANPIYNGYQGHSGLDLWLGTLAFAFQIYCDFSAYSDIARGTSKLMGFDLMLNFRLPYFATSPSDFWRRWHISLSTWLRDYLYIPLGGNRGSKWKVQRNLMITMLLGGLWHGAAWNFVLWGLFHGLILAIYRVADRTGDDASLDRPRAYLRHFLRMGLMFVLTLIGWVLFRCEGMHQIVHFFTHMHLGVSDRTAEYAYRFVVYAAPLVLIQVLQQRSGDLMVMMRLPRVLLGLYYGVLIAAIAVFGVRETVEFIYFQF